MGYYCICTDTDRRNRWRVTQRNCNHSTFNGRKRTPSRYSEVQCLKCGRSWRTTAAYVRTLLDR